MAYEPTQWKTGDVVTSAKLNKLEQGVAGAGGDGALVVNIFYDEDTVKFVADKTVNEILTAVNAGVFVYAYIDDGDTWECLHLLYASVNGVTFCTVPTVDSSGVSQSTYAISSEGNEVTIEKKAYQASDGVS